MQRGDKSREWTADGQKNGEPVKAKNARGKSCNGAEPMMADRTEKLQRLSFETGQKRACVKAQAAEAGERRACIHARAPDGRQRTDTLQRRDPLQPTFWDTANVSSFTLP